MRKSRAISNKTKVNKQTNNINVIEYKKQEKEEKGKKEEETFSNEWEQLINYKFNSKGELVHKKTLKKCPKLDFQEYELVGIYVQNYVENYLITKYNLTTLYVPNKNINPDFSKRDDTQAQCKILTTKDFPTNPKCLIIIQGSGSVRLGQWSRSVCINENLQIGAMGPYIENAIKNKFSVIILNPNERNDFIYEKNKIEEFKTMEDHCLYVYYNIIRKNENIKEIYIVAHSMGGGCAIEILLINFEDLLNGKIKKIAFIDSVHGDDYKDLGDVGLKKFRAISRNFIRSTKPAGTFLGSYEKAKKGVNFYSSGHNEHEYTSGYAVSEVFKFLCSGEVKNKSKSAVKWKVK